MRHLRAWTAGILVAAILTGCGPGKELPDDPSKPTLNGQGGEELKEKIPDKSDPVAVEIVERAIKVHTENNRSLLAKAKTSKLTATGTIKLPFGENGEQVHVSANRTFLARWPDEIKFTVDFRSHRAGMLTLILRGRFTWKGVNSVPEPNLNPQKVEEDMRADGYGLQWLVLLFPLAEKNVVIFDPRKGGGVGSPAADVIRVVIPGRPIYRLHFDPNSGALTQVDYTHIDATGRVFTEWMLSDHKRYDGFLLPSNLKMARTTDRPKFRDLVEEWKVDNWEFPEQLDDKSFDAPR